MSQETLRLQLLQSLHTLGEQLLSCGANDSAGLITELQGQVCDLTRKHGVAQEELRRRDDTITQLQSQVMKLKLAHDTLETTHLMSKHEIERARMECATQLQGLEAQMSTLKREHEEDLRANSSRVAQMMDGRVQDKMVETAQLRVKVDALESRCEELKVEVVRLEGLVHEQDLHRNISSNLGSNLEVSVVEFLQAHLGGVAEISRTRANMCGDILMHFSNDLRVMVEIKNSKSAQDTTLLKRSDRDKFFQDMERCIPQPHASILFAVKRVDTEKVVVFPKPTVALVGNGDTQALLHAVHQVTYHAHLTTQPHMQDSATSECVRDLLNHMGTMHQTGVKTLKDITNIITRFNAQKRADVMQCFSHIESVEATHPGIVTGPFRNALQVGVQCTKRKFASK
jgi:hypothetical protein